jgi:CBS domain-containing protein
MLARDLIADSIPPVKTSDTAALVLDWIGEFKVAHLPIVNHENLLGLVSEEDLLEVEDLSLPVGNISLSIPTDAFVMENSHIFEAAKIMAHYKLDVVPVVDADKRYSGLITKSDLVQYLTDIVGAKEPGGVIELEVPLNNYMVSEIGRICESNDAKIISLTTTPTHDHSLLLVTIKLNIRELSRVVSTFQRFNYTIRGVVFDAEQIDDVRSNYENLLKYLSM